MASVGMKVPQCVWHGFGMTSVCEFMSSMGVFTASVCLGISWWV